MHLFIYFVLEWPEVRMHIDPVQWPMGWLSGQEMYWKIWYKMYGWTDGRRHKV